MKTLYIECNMGAAGDMLLAALLELMPDREKALKQLNGMGIPGVVYTADSTLFRRFCCINNSGGFPFHLAVSKLFACPAPIPATLQEHIASHRILSTFSFVLSISFILKPLYAAYRSPLLHVFPQTARFAQPHSSGRRV